MTPNELIRNLECERKKLEGKTYNTFETNTYAMITDCIGTIKEMQEKISELEQQAKIGCALQKAFDESYARVYGYKGKPVKAINVDDFMAWAGDTP